MIEKRCRCGGELYVDVPPFNLMSDEDIADWQQAGGRVMLVCKDCGYEDESTKPKKGSQLNKNKKEEM